MREELAREIRATVQELFDVELDIELTRPAEQFGDYATNAALQLVARLDNSSHGGPRQIAAAIAEHMKGRMPAIRKLSVAGPGFINIHLTDAALWQSARAEPEKSLAGKTIVAEYSDPNPFKVLHAGHLYTSIVGDAIANLLAAAGANVHRVNFGGDVGLHVAMTMWAIITELGGENPEKLSDLAADEKLDWISQRYVDGNHAYENDAAAREAIVIINKRVYELHAQQDHDSPFAKIYWTCRQWSYDGFETLYDRLGMVPFEKYYPESTTTALGVETVRRGLEQGVFKESDGAVIFAGETYGLHTRVFLTTEGLPTYEAKDLGLAMHKWQDYHFDQNIIITGNDIIEYMKVVLAATSHFAPEVAERTLHLTHGMVKMAGGIKMSSRKGNILRGTDVLDAAAAANQRLSGQDNEAVVLGAVKYAFLRPRLGGDIIYDPAESVSIEGNSGPYLQYAHARARSILAKAGYQSGASPDAVAGELEPAERSLLRKISEYPEAVSAAINELLPSHICTYLFELAVVFNHFYEHNRVIGDDRQILRLELVATYARVLQSGLALINIPAPEHL